jgi:drug/metabolite transporter (DMT)-like permease
LTWLKRLFAHQLAPSIVLVCATLLWGGSFVITRNAVQTVPPLVFVSVRFATAALFVCLATRPQLARITRLDIKAGTRIGLAMFGGYGLQAIGMHLGVASGRAAFISALYVPIVPVLQLLLLRRRPKPAIWVGLGLACVGLMLLAGNLGNGGAGRGEGLVLIGAFSIAAEILALGLYAPQVDPRRLAVVECLFLSLLCLGTTWATQGHWPAPSPGWLLSAAALGLASAVLQISVNWAQRFVPPARATLIYALEPVWAALFGLAAGETMGAAAIAGAALILVSLVISGR